MDRRLENKKRAALDHGSKLDDRLPLATINKRAGRLGLAFEKSSDKVAKRVEMAMRTEDLPHCSKIQCTLLWQSAVHVGS